MHLLLDFALKMWFFGRNYWSPARGLQGSFSSARPEASSLKLQGQDERHYKLNFIVSKRPAWKYRLNFIGSGQSGRPTRPRRQYRLNFIGSGRPGRPTRQRGAWRYPNTMRKCHQFPSAKTAVWSISCLPKPWSLNGMSGAKALCTSQ